MQDSATMKSEGQNSIPPAPPSPAQVLKKESKRKIHSSGIKLKCLLCAQGKSIFSTKWALNKHYEDFHRDCEGRKVPCVHCHTEASLDPNSHANKVPAVLSRGYLRAHYTKQHKNCWNSKLYSELYLFPHPYYSTMQKGAETPNRSSPPTEEEISQQIEEFNAKEGIKFKALVDKARTLYIKAGATAKQPQNPQTPQKRDPNTKAAVSPKPAIPSGSPTTSIQCQNPLKMNIEEDGSETESSTDNENEGDDVLDAGAEIDENDEEFRIDDGVASEDENEDIIEGLEPSAKRRRISTSENQQTSQTPPPPQAPVPLNPLLSNNLLTKQKQSSNEAAVAPKILQNPQTNSAKVREDPQVVELQIQILEKNKRIENLEKSYSEAVKESATLQYKNAAFMKEIGVLQQKNLKLEAELQKTKMEIEQSKK